MRSVMLSSLLFALVGCGSSSSPDLAPAADLSIVDQAVRVIAGDSANPSDCPPSIRGDQLSPPAVACTGTPIEKCKYQEYTCVCQADDQKLHCAAP